MIKYEKWLMALIMLAALALFLLAGKAFADTNTVTWTNPTQRTNGTALNATDIAGSTIEWGTCSGNVFGTTRGTGTTSAGTTTNFVTPDLAPGIWCHRVKTRLLSGAESAWSNVVAKTIVESPPNAPTIVTVTTTAYELRGVWTKRMVAVGTVELGTACGNQWRKDNSYARVTRADVTITTRYKGGRLYGTCDSAS